MEHIQNLDVSWMTHGNPKDKAARNATARPRSSSNSVVDPPVAEPFSNRPPSPAVNGTQTEQPKPIYPMRASDEDRNDKRPPSATSTPQRRNSWFSNISSKFGSGGGGAAQSPPQATAASPKPAEFSVPKAIPAKNAVLVHASRHEGEGPYTPAPPKSAQTGLLHVFRRLSSSNGTLSPNVKGNNHGLVERRVLNVDRHRERCGINGLNQAKLRRVAFCVDVEIAPQPKYADEVDERHRKEAKAAKDQKKKIKERGEGEALKHPKAVEIQKEVDGEIKVTGEEIPKEPPSEGNEGNGESRTSIDNPSDKAASAGKKKDKKKKSEEERKARKEKRRKQAEANGTVPMELHYDSDSSSSGASPHSGAPPKPQTVPTTNPVRIYRRCCQLRETPILRKITEQLLDPANCSTEPGMVEKLDLAGYWMQLPDLITLGDYLAVVPVREVILENCGLTDEGLRVILAGLLAARKPKARRRKSLHGPDGLTEQGGVVERLVLKNNKIGPEGWKHLCLFIYLCRTLKCLDLSGMPFPRQPAPAAPTNGSPTPAGRQPLGLCKLLFKSLADRLGGSLTLLGLGQTGLDADQLGSVIDGVIKCRVKRLNLANNNISAEGLGHVARFLRSGLCEGLDLGGNDLRDGLATLADALTGEGCPLWALSLADCNLTPSSLCKLLPILARLGQFKFIDLSHNHELFSSNPSAVSVLRRYLPKMVNLKRIHLADCALSPEQVIALAEILPEVEGLAHISLLENPQLMELATNARSEERQEEACALFASLLAAARVSTSLVAVDIEVPSEQSSDLVKALAKQVVAYCLRNMELAAATATETQAELLAKGDPAYPDALQRLVGRDIMVSEDMDADVDAAPDEDYVIGGTGVVRALTACLKNRGDESRRQSGEFIRDVENGVAPPRAVPGGSGAKAKETSKHLLLSARKIRLRLQPAIDKARSTATDTQTYNRLMFLQNTLNGIIKRFEDEFPDTRVSVDSGVDIANIENNSAEKPPNGTSALAPLTTTTDDRPESPSDDADDMDNDPAAIKSPLSRSNSTISLSSRALAHEEGRVLRAGHKFRAGVVASPEPEHEREHYALLASGLELVDADPNHKRMLHELVEELGNAEWEREVREKGVVAVFREREDEIRARLRAADPAYWDRFVESQRMARANVKLESQGRGGETAVED